MEIPTFHLACIGCLTCQLLDPDIRVALTMPTPMSSLHKSPRFGDKEIGITLNGVNVADVWSDAMLGAEGWIWRYHIQEKCPLNKIHYCPFCHKQPCMYVEHGRVEIPRVEPRISSILDEPEIGSIFHV